MKHLLTTVIMIAGVVGIWLSVLFVEWVINTTKDFSRKRPKLERSLEKIGMWSSITVFLVLLIGGLISAYIEIYRII